MLSRLLAVGFWASTLVLAQRGGDAGGGRGPDSGMASAFFGASRLDRLSDALKLSKDQKKAVKTAMDDGQKLATPIHEQLLKSQLAIGEAIAAGKSQEEILKAVRAAAEIHTQITAIEMHAYAKIVLLLEPNQKQLGIRLTFQMVRGVFDGKNWNIEQ